MCVWVCLSFLVSWGFILKGHRHSDEAIRFFLFVFFVFQRRIQVAAVQLAWTCACFTSVSRFSIIIIIITVRSAITHHFSFAQVLSLFFSFFFFECWKERFFYCCCDLCAQTKEKSMSFSSRRVRFFFFSLWPFVREDMSLFYHMSSLFEKKDMLLFSSTFFFSPALRLGALRELHHLLSDTCADDAAVHAGVNKRFFLVIIFFFLSFLSFIIINIIFLSRHVSRQAQCLAHMHRSSTQASMFDKFLCRRRNSIV